MAAFPPFSRSKRHRPRPFPTLRAAGAYSASALSTSCPASTPRARPREGELAHQLFNFVSMTEGWTVPLRIYQEPIAAWRVTASAMSAALRLGEALRRDEPGAPDDVSRLFADMDVASSKPAVAVGGQRARLSALTNGWLRESAFRPSFEWPFTASKPELVLDAPPNDASASPAADGGEGFRWPARSLYSVLLTQFLTELANG